MNDSAPSSISERSRPYLGLDYYHEEDSALFTERENELDDCTSMLLGMNVKILILQGTTGSGKSSFLRAGLIPRLRQGNDRPTHFLSDGECVIRCTANPLIWLYTQLDSALTSKRFRLDAPLDWPSAEMAHAMMPNALADAILTDLRLICKKLPGHLVVILDQAEEVLTQSLDQQGLSSSAKAFFYFLESVYLQDIDVRIVIALRTEYYGRFRDELRIDDSQISTSAHRGGIEPYLLRALRDRDALVRIILKPTTAMQGDALLFNFTFDTRAATRIVADLLAYFPHGSVTPFLQVICAILFEHLSDDNRQITLEDYDGLGDIRGIALLYLARGIAQAVGPDAPADEQDAWLLLLHSLTSAQGGGAVLSNIQSIEALQQTARALGLQGDIRFLLTKLCEEKSPLLRGLPPESPTQFSLKHDVLAIVLVRWKAEYSARIAEQTARMEAQAAHLAEEKARLAEQETRKKTTIRTIRNVVLAAICITAGLGFVFYKKAESDALITPVIGRLSAALNPPRSEYGESLETIIDSIDVINRAPMLLSADRDNLKKDALKQLQSVILRSPVFYGEFTLADFNAMSGTLSILQKQPGETKPILLGSVNIKRLNSRAQGEAEKIRSLDAAVSKNIVQGNTATGWIEGIGTAALIDSKVYFVDAKSGEPRAIDLAGALSPKASPLQYARVEIRNGRLYGFSYRPGPHTLTIQGAVLTGAQILAAPGEVTWTGLTDATPWLPPPFYSDASTTPGFFAYFSSVEETGKPDRYGWHIQPTSGPPAVLPSVGDSTVADDMRLGFVSGDRAVLLQRQPGKFEYLPLASDKNRAVPSNRNAGVSDGPLPLTFADNGGPASFATAPIPSYTPWVASPLAAIRQGDRLMIAWMTQGGVALAAGNLGQPMKNPLSGTAVLLSGEPNGSRLQFSEDGNFLILKQQPYPSRPSRIRIWDVSAARANAIATSTEPELIRLACAILEQARSSGQHAERDSRACAKFVPPASGDPL